MCAHIASAEPWWEPGTAQGYHMVTFGFILGEITRRVTGRTLGQYLRTEIAEPLGIDVHIGLPAAEHHRCAEMVNKPHIRDVLADGGAPGYPTSLTEHPMAAFSIAMGFVPDDELGSEDIDVLAVGRIPGHQRPRHRARDWRRSTTRSPRASCLSYEHMEQCRISQGGFDTDLVLGQRVADHGWGLGYMLNQRGVERPQQADLRPRRLGRLVSGSSTSNTASATPT